jgi:hypothetical protein
MKRANYEDKICQRLELAERIPFRQVSADDWQPTVAWCHKNVDVWVGMNPGDSAVRGWVTNASFLFAMNLVAHSVVRGGDGTMFDITPLDDEENRGVSVRRGMRFVEHLGGDKEFFAFEAERNSMACPLPASEWPEFDAPIDDGES